MEDLQFISVLYSYRKEEQLIAGAAMKSFQYHLWYLTEELVVIALYDPN